MNEEPFTETKSESNTINDQAGLLPKEELKRPGLSLLSLFVAGVVMMLLWWDTGEIGLRWSLSVLVVCALYNFNSRLQERKVPPSSWILLGLTLLAGSIPAFRSEEYTKLLSMLVSFVCLAGLSMDFFSGQWWQYRLREYLMAAFSTMLPFSSVPGDCIPSNQISKAPEQRTPEDTLPWSSERQSDLNTAFAGFTFLCAYADAIFESKVDSLFEWLRAIFVTTARRILLTSFSPGPGCALWLLVAHSSKLKRLNLTRLSSSHFWG